jgi:hypothetical protein
MLEDGNQKQLKQFGFNRIWDPYSIGTEKAQNTPQVAENKGWLPFVDAFRTFCLEPGVQGRSVLLAIPQITPLFSSIATGPEATYER